MISVGQRGRSSCLTTSPRNSSKRYSQIHFLERKENATGTTCITQKRANQHKILFRMYQCRKRLEKLGANERIILKQILKMGGKHVCWIRKSGHDKWWALVDTVIKHRFQRLEFLTSWQLLVPQKCLPTVQLIPTLQKTQYAYVKKQNMLMLFRGIVPVYCEHHTEHINTPWGQNTHVLCRPTCYMRITPRLSNTRKRNSIFKLTLGIDMW
jgi:hypothetical protein